MTLLAFGPVSLRLLDLGVPEGLHGLAHRHGGLCGLRRVAGGDGLDLHRLDLHRLDLDGHGGLDGMDLDRSAEDVGRVGLEQH